jgi:hypothetical protein
MKVYPLTAVSSYLPKIIVSLDAMLQGEDGKPTKSIFI